MNLLQNKLVLITGGSKGIGKAMAELFAANGANLVLLSRDLQKLKELQSELIQKYQNEIQIFECDIRKPDEIKSVFEKLSSEKKYINVLVNNAGIMIDATLQVVKPDIISAIYETNVYGTMYASQFALKHFVRNRSGSIINLSSIIGTNGNLGQTVYGSSKTAVIGFTKSLSKELAALNIRVNAIAPGFIDTDMTKGMDPKFYEKNLASIGMRRLGKPEDVAKTALFLASDLSEYVTGQIIGVDGGMII
jgi:3-oxoacyl-[acyl-carrier protein] reductase